MCECVCVCVSVCVCVRERERERECVCWAKGRELTSFELANSAFKHLTS